MENLTQESRGEHTLNAMTLRQALNRLSKTDSRRADLKEAYRTELPGAEFYPESAGRYRALPAEQCPQTLERGSGEVDRMDGPVSSSVTASKVKLVDFLNCLGRVTLGLDG